MNRFVTVRKLPSLLLVLLWLAPGGVAAKEKTPDLLDRDDVIEAAEAVTADLYPNADDVVVDEYIHTVYQADGTYQTIYDRWFDKPEGSINYVPELPTGGDDGTLRADGLGVDLAGGHCELVAGLVASGHAVASDDEFAVGVVPGFGCIQFALTAKDSAVADLRCGAVRGDVV